MFFVSFVVICDIWYQELFNKTMFLILQFWFYSLLMFYLIKSGSYTCILYLLVSQSKVLCACESTHTYLCMHKYTHRNMALDAFKGASLVAQLVKNPPAVRETWVWSLGWEDPLEKGTTTHSNILAWRIPWTI